MPLIKGIIIVFIWLSFFPEEAQASIGPEESGAFSCILQGTSQEHPADALMLSLFFHSGDLTPCCSCNTYDKKNFIKLFFHPEYIFVLPPAITQPGRLPRHPSPGMPNTAAYYIYTLQKIVI